MENKNKNGLHPLNIVGIPYVNGYYKIWNRKQLEALKEKYESIKEAVQTDFELELYNEFKAVIKTMEANIGILCDQYSDNRNVDKDLGGWLAFFPEPITEADKYYKDLLNLYHIKSSELAEVNEVIVSIKDKIDFILQIFICSSDYALIVIFPRLMNSEGGRNETVI
jgi:hypothetical protein